MKKKSFVQKGENDFIVGVVKAVLKRDITKQHILIDDSGLLKYLVFPVEQYIDDIASPDGSRVKILCVFSKELIEDFNEKALNDDLSKVWAKKAVKYVIAKGKETAEEIYN